jgi:RNA polymerase sigma-70 factor (ECF subfamily)
MAVHDLDHHLPRPAGADPGLADLLAQVARGDRAAFASLYHHTSAQVLGLVNLMLGDTAAAEDVTATVYQQLWHTAARYDPARGSVHAWLLRAAHREAATHLRARHAAAPATPPAGTAAAELASLSPVLSPATLARLDTLSRELILLVYYRGYTGAQAASLLGLPATSARPRLHAALRALPPPPGQTAATLITELIQRSAADQRRPRAGSAAAAGTGIPTRLGLALLTVLHTRGQPGSSLVIDMTRATSVDSVGLRALLTIHHRAAQLGIKFCLAAPSRQVRRLLQLIDIAGRIPVFTSVAAALTASSPPAAITGLLPTTLETGSSLTKDELVLSHPGNVTPRLA